MAALQTPAFDASGGVNFRPQPSYEARKKAQLLRDEIDSVNELRDAADSDGE